jgi:hypothetical protein
MKHLDEVGETYWQHFKFAAGMGLALFIAGICVMIHAILPTVFPNIGSIVIRHAHKRLDERNKGDDNG